MSHWHICISGCLQNEGQATGMDRLWQELRAVVTGPEAIVEMREWNADWEHLADRIARYAGDTPPVVCIYGYSWGGYSAVVLAMALERRGIAVRGMVLSDAVYRHPYPWGQWRALVPWSIITVPPNVAQVWSFRQREDLPRGHKVIAVDRTRTRVYRIQAFEVQHSGMDELKAFHRRALIVAHEAEGNYPLPD